MALKYIWRAGLKTEEGICDKEKEVEDIRKAIWYIEDYEKQLKDRKYTYYFPKDNTSIAEEIAESYTEHVAMAITKLAKVGCIIGRRVTRMAIDEFWLFVAKEHLLSRIEEIGS